MKSWCLKHEERTVCGRKYPEETTGLVIRMEDGGTPDRTAKWDERTAEVTSRKRVAKVTK